MIIQSKHLKPLNQVAITNSDSVDRISELPTNLLCHILAFLPTRGAVSTSILSKKWRYVWTLVPVLDFTDLPSSMTNKKTVFTLSQYVTFAIFVNRVLLLNSAPCLKRLHFETYEGYPVAKHVNEWMLAISRRCVQELCLIIKLNFCVNLPSSFLVGKEKLVVLKLQGLKLKLPSSFHLPCLQSLSLIKVDFENEDGTLTDDPWTRFLSSCPVIEKLNIDRCDFWEDSKKLENFSVCSSSIKILRIVLDKIPRRAIIIQTPNLEILHLSTGIIRPELNDLSSLVEARLEFWTTSVRWSKLLQRICHTKTLVLYPVILDGSSAFMQSPVFGNLTHLEVGFSEWSIVLQIIKHAPKLVSFIIHKLMFSWPDSKPRKKELLLERIEYHGFDNVEEGFEVVEHFLSNSSQLKEFRIYTYSWLDSMAMIEILTKLLKFPRASNQCKITVVKEDYKSKSEDSDNESEGWISDATTSTSLEDEDEDEDSS